MNVIGSDRAQLIESLKFIRDAKNSLVMAALSLDQMERFNFNKTVSNIKEVVGDLVCTEKTLDNFLS
jgi:hypothetical protein